MGFTIEDMLIIARDKYEMELIGGRNGWANSISWLMMVEDTVIIRNFRGKELAVTTGMGFETEKSLLNLVAVLDKHHAAGLIINVGGHLHDIPTSVIEAANRCDLPLMTVPWNVDLSEMIKDLTVRIFLQSQTDEQISAAYIKAIEAPELVQEYREELAANFDVDGLFQVVLFTTPNLDRMDTVERKRIGYRLQLYLENISHNAHFFYYDGFFVMIFNAVDDPAKDEIVRGFVERARRRMPEQPIYVGVGTEVVDASRIHTSYARAKYACACAVKRGRPLLTFDKLGIERVLYSIGDEEICKELQTQILAPVVAYDEAHHAELLRTLMMYIRYNGSIQRVAAEMYIHKNTISYRMGKIKELLGNDLEDEEYRILLYLAGVMKEIPQDANRN